MKPDNGHIKLSAEQTYYLQRTQVVSELHDEIESWAKKRFWGIAIIVIVVGFFGVRSIVRDMIVTELHDARKATAIAEAASDHAKEVSKEVRKEAEAYRTVLEKISGRATEVSSQIDGLSATMKAEGLHAIETTRLDVKNMEAKLRELDKLVRGIASSSGASQKTLTSYDARLVELSRDASKSKAKFSKNADFRVMVTYT